MSGEVSKEEEDESNIAGMWMSLLSRQESSLADDGAVAETITDPILKETESVNIEKTTGG